MPERQVVGWFDIDAAARAQCQPDALPVFCIGDDKDVFYGACACCSSVCDTH